MSDTPSTSDQGVRAPADFNPRTEPVLDFPNADFGALTPADYDAIGFLGGLEVHQQLLTRTKLFCRCPAGRTVHTFDAEVLRHMRPTLSELGEYDGTALMEFKTRKDIVYRLERSSVCTYEIDDTPPFEIDDEAVRIAIELSTLLNLNLVSELHVMRKQYLDGSIPTGFQRTVMIGLDGAIPFVVPELGVSRDLRIRQLSLEEDSCREVSDVGHRITFKTDRLGVPLTEAVTEPELLTPLEVQAAGRLLAAVARATGQVRRGAGAARQDVNVSIAGGRRVEIKGVHYHRRLPQLVHVEAFRQLNLLRVRAELHRRGVSEDMFAIPAVGVPWEVSLSVADVTDLLSGAKVSAMREAAERGATGCAVRLPGFAGLLAHATQPRVTFAQELSERVRVIACPEHSPFMTHSDAESGLGADEWREIRQRVGAGAGDAIVIVWAPRDDAATAAREILIRAQDALLGVPAETRQARPDGTTGFERILPGPDRMYPDTDTPPLPIQDTVVEQIRTHLPETPWAREARYVELGLEEDLARRLVRSPWADLFDAVNPPVTLARRTATTILVRLSYHRRRAGSEPVVEPERVTAIVRAVAAGEVRIEAFARMIDAITMEPDTPIQAIVHRYRERDTDDETLQHAIDSAVTGARTLRRQEPEAALRWAMGQVMSSLLGRVDPQRVRTMLGERLAGVAPEAV